MMIVGGLAAQASNAAPIPDLSSYPESERIWLGIEEGIVRPKAFSQARSQLNGNVRLLAEDGQELKKGELWAVLDPENLELERRSLEVEEYNFTQKIRDNKKSHREKLTSAQLDLNEVEQTKSRLLLALESDQTPSELKGRLREAIQKAKEEIVFLQDALTPEQQEKDLQMEEEEGRLVLEKKRKQYEELKKRSELTAQFDGILKFSSRVKEELAAHPNGLIWMDANQLIGSVTDEQSLEIVVSAKSPLINQIRKEDLLILMEQSQTGKLISATFQKVDELDTGAEVQTNYLFEIASGSTEVARHSTGQLNLIHVYRKLPVPCRIVLKKDIAFIDPTTLEISGWEGLAMKLWPGCTIEQVASQTIAIRAPNGH